MTKSSLIVNRRVLLGRAAAVGAGALVASAGLRETLAAPTAGGRLAARRFQGLTGEITVSYPDELGKKPPFVDKAAEAVQSANPGAKVNVDLQKVGDDDFYTKLLLALDAGDAPDVFHIGGSSIGELAEAGYIAPLDDYTAKWEDFQYYPDSVRSGVTYKGHLWAIPYGLDTRFLYFRKDRLQEAGLSADWQPANLQGIIDAAKAVKTAGKAIPYALYAGQAGSSGTADHAFVPLVWAYGGDVITADGKWVGNSTAIQKTLAYYADAYLTDELVPKEILTTTKPWTAMREKLGNGGLALLFEGGWVYGGWYSADQAGTEANVGYLLHPTESAGPSFTIGGPGTCWYINAASKNKDLAWEFIKAFNNKDTVAQLNIGDPHPVARTDSADVPEFKAQKFLVDSTESLKSARFVPPDPNYSKVITAIQTATGNVASGSASPEDAAKRYADDLARALGDDLVVTQ
ncbi:MAG TPA: extracellular solute-binding protein [Thermomicrobiales bacterium]|jgi:multiple sugar transport system substrate-binding protein